MGTPTKQSKDVESLLWRAAFYRFIEDHRKRIHKYSAAAAANVAGASASLDKVCLPTESVLQSKTALALGRPDALCAPRR